MPTDTHAVLGASSAARWRACPGSVREIERVPPRARSQSSSYAQEGNAAHYLAELALRDRELDLLDYRGAWIAAHGAISDDQEHPDLPGAWFQVDDEMIDAANLYREVVCEHLDRLGNAELSIEERVFPVPGRRDELFGTVDAGIYEPWGELIAIDFKYGKGVIVDVERNDQIMYYALGLLQRVLELGEEPTRITLVVVQPRAQHVDGPIRSWETSREELLRFGEELARDADATKAPNAPLVAGEHCRFCPAAMFLRADGRVETCQELHRTELAEVVDSLPNDLEEPADARLPAANDPVDLSRALKVAQFLDWWAGEVKKMAQHAAEGGLHIPGYKLVQGRSQRRWNDEGAVERALKRKRGVKQEDIYSKKLRSPAQLEKNPKVGKDWVRGHCYKPPGKTVLAPEADPRPEVPAAIDALTAIED